ncbi:MAG TPA: alpha/beta hydrolase-fold protein [Kineosporiaceae bacterium]
MLSLTSGVFGWFLVLLTLAAFVAVIVFWHVVTGHQPLRVAARVSMLLGVNLMVLLTAAVQLNNQFLFFADWADLAGAIGGTTTTSDLHRGETATKAAQASVAGSAATQAPRTLEPLPAGSQIQDGVMSYQVTGAKSRVTTSVLVTLPPGYSATDDTTAYPVLETFSGYPGSVSQWVKTMRLQTNLSQQVAAHKLHPLIVVSPQLEVPAGVDTECVNGKPGSPQMETFLTEDVPNWITAHFRTKPGRASWATIGLSAGGWCAAMAAMLHPAQYGGAVVMGGYFHPQFESAYDPFTAGSDAGHRYDLVALAKASPMPLALWVETSHADPVSYTSTTALLKAAKAPLSVTDVVLQNAGHRIGVWQGLVPDALRWLGANVPGFAP